VGFPAALYFRCGTRPALRGTPKRNEGKHAEAQ
jgi:hypothetical protein